RHAPGRLHPAQGPFQGHHHFRRREHLLDRGRGRALQASRCCCCCCCCQGRQKMGRDPLRLRRIKARRHGKRRRAHAMVPPAFGRLQSPASCHVRGAPEDLDRQDSEVQAARDGEGRVSSFFSPHCREKQTQRLGA